MFSLLYLIVSHRRAARAQVAAPLPLAPVAGPVVVDAPYRLAA